jgi:SusD/RagB-like outer membrane lipoprotein
MKLYKYLYLLSLPATMMVSCKKSDFVAVNINPSILTTIDPGNQFLMAADHLVKDYEYFYDFNKDISAWMQYSTGVTGNGPSFTSPGALFNYRYDNFYSNVGTPLADIPQLIAKMSSTDQAARVDEAAIAQIYMAYEAFYVSDINGSIPYSQAFKARYGGTLTPTYDPQAMVFDSVDAQVKAAVSVLENTNPANQVMYNGFDPFYGSLPSSAAQAQAWAKAGNALRLKVAMRWMKRDPTKMAAIVTSVLADANQMSSIADSWVLTAGPAFATATGNFNTKGYLAAKPMVDFMVSKADPRLRMFYRKDSVGTYGGSPTNPDTCTLPSYQTAYLANRIFSALQHRLFTPAYDEGDGNGPGNGVAFFPVITYAEYCFIRADLAARGITGDVAETWYKSGITASITFYDQAAQNAKINGYKPLAAGEITSYLDSAGITFNSAKAIEQIACQANIEFFRQPAEAWAWWKRTGFPNTNSVLAWSPLTTNGSPLVLPRRPQFNTLPISDANYANQQAAYNAMKADAYFGNGLSDYTGRIWWDMP